MEKEHAMLKDDHENVKVQWKKVILTLVLNQTLVSEMVKIR